jgi:hypothetical protein
MNLELILPEHEQRLCDDCLPTCAPARVTLTSDDAPAELGFWALCHGCLILKLVQLADANAPAGARVH